MNDDALDRIAEHMASLDETERRALVRLFGAIYDPRDLPSARLCEAIRDIGSLDDDGMTWLAGWFQDNVNMWGGIVSGAMPEGEVVKFTQRRAPAAQPPKRVQHQIGSFRKVR